MEHSQKAASVFIPQPRPVFHVAAAFAQIRKELELPMTLCPPIEPAPTLLSAPIELADNWGHMLPRSADLVIERMRHSCLDGVRLISDRQPTRLRVDEHRSGLPAVWLHPDGSTMAWIIVDIGERAWAQLAYQFGHELGQAALAAPPVAW
jgi:hypothetical protein